MRDPARIKRILDKLEKTWTAAPDLRLCQLLSNTIIGPETRDIFYIEDDKVEAAIDARLKNPPVYIHPKKL